MKILVLAGGFDQIALIKELQTRGHEVILADYLDNPPAKTYVEKHFLVSTLDEDAVYHLALQERVDLVTTACTDQALLTAARVSEKLSLPFYLTSYTAQNITNKVYMKKKFKEYSIPTAESCTLENNKDLEKIENNLVFPLIVKPCDANSSKGVVKVKNKEDLIQAVNYAFTISRSKKVILENFMDGEEISIDVWKDKEGAKVLLISKTGKIKMHESNFTIYQSQYPVELSDNAKYKIQDIADKICLAFKLQNTPLLIQAVVNGDDISVIECSARMGGGTKYRLVQHITGIDIMSIYVDRILGNIMQCPSVDCFNKKVELNYVYAYNGVFQKLLGFGEQVSAGNIVEVFQYKQPGSKIEKRTTSSDRVLGFLLEADTYEELQKKRYSILEKTDILDENGKSIMYKECFFQRD